MDERFSADELGATPSIQVTVFRNGDLIHRERCETDAAASEVAQYWSELDGAVECQIDDFSFSHQATDVLEPTESELPDEDDRRAPEGRER